MKVFKLISLLVCLLSFQILICQEQALVQESKKLDKTSYDKLVKELDYSKTKRTVRFKKGKSNKKRKKKKKEKEPSSFSIPGLGNAISLLAYAAIISLIVILVYLIFSNIKLDKNIDAELDETEPETLIENINDLDMNQKYQEALASGDYRSAVRWQFLHALQILSQKEIINWKPDKTNRDYNREIINVSLKNDFRQIARYYEQVWYGNNVLDQHTFDILNVHFTGFIKQQNVK